MKRVLKFLILVFSSSIIAILIMRFEIFSNSKDPYSQILFTILFSSGIVFLLNNHVFKASMRSFVLSQLVFSIAFSTFLYIVYQALSSIMP